LTLAVTNLITFPDEQGATQAGSRSELMTYQPSPYNNNLDLNELLQNVDDVDAISASG
jgi:hypothetical protein